MYGTWLQGKEKGFVKDGVIRGGNIAIKRDCERKLKCSPIRLNSKEKRIVQEAIISAGEKYNQQILAISVHSNHVHVVCDYSEIPIGMMVARYKAAGRLALGRGGRIWTKGYDVRYCYDEGSLKTRVSYVNSHGENAPR